MSDEFWIWIGVGAAILLVVMEPRVAEAGWFVLKIVLFVVIAATLFFGIGVFGIALISVISKWLGGGKK